MVGGHEVYMHPSWLCLCRCASWFSSSWWGFAKLQMTKMARLWYDGPPQWRMRLYHGEIDIILISFILELEVCTRSFAISVDKGDHFLGIQGTGARFTGAVAHPVPKVARRAIARHVTHIAAEPIGRDRYHVAYTCLLYFCWGWHDRECCGLCRLQYLHHIAASYSGTVRRPVWPRCRARQLSIV